MQPQKSVLGKGLASLLPGAGVPNTQPPAIPTQNTENVSAASAPMQHRHLGISMALLEDIKINPYQPRREFDPQTLQELAASIQMNGIIQPLVVRKTETGFELIAGERRLRAAKIAGLKQVPIVIRKSTDKESLELAILENIQRQNLNCVEEAQAYFRLLNEFSLTQEQISERLGKERASVANSLRLLKLPEMILNDLKTGGLSFGHGKVILSLEDHDQRIELRNRILAECLSVRGAETTAQEIKMRSHAAGEAPTQETNTEESKSLSAVAQRLKNMALELTRSVGSRVEIKGNSRRGKIVLHYGNPEELEHVIETLQTKKI